MDNTENSTEPQSGINVEKSYRTPPYISFSTFLTFLGDLKENGTPPQIDRSILTRFSGGVQGQLMAALRALDLLEEGDRPSTELALLVESYETDEFSLVLKALIKNTYPYVFALDLMTATPSMFSKSFSDNLPAKEEVLRKCRTFFLQASKEAGIPIGNRIETAKFPRNRNPSAKKTPQNNSKKEKSDIEEDSAKTTIKHEPISEKALEYRLVDLMGEAASDPEVMASIIKVITYLKTKDIEEGYDD